MDCWTLRDVFNLYAKSIVLLGLQYIPRYI